MQESGKTQTTTSDTSENERKRVTAVRAALQEAARKAKRPTEPSDTSEAEKKEVAIVRAALQEAARKAREGR